jgi:hypothetical protein
MAFIPHLQSQQSLFIATPNTIRRRSRTVDEILFECHTTDSIVSARVSRDNSSLFAVADSHVVILCDTTRGNRDYRLKKGDVRQAMLVQASIDY